MARVSALQRWWRQRLSQRWPEQREVLLDHRRILVLPSRTGAGFLLLLSLMLVAAINFQNNLALALVLWLLALMMVSMLHAYMNLSGLRVIALRAHPAFAGQPVRFELELRCRGRRPRQALQLGWWGQSAQTRLDLRRRGIAQLYLDSERRGWLRPPAVCVASTWPLGLIRAWGWIDLDWRALVYPRPEPGSNLPAGPDGSSLSGSRHHSAAGDEFDQLRDYRPGDSPRHVLWKSHARGGPLQTRVLMEPRQEQRWLDYSAARGSREQRLASLCHWVITLSARRQPFGLRLPGLQLPLGSGDPHRSQALRALALHEVES